MIKNFRDGSMTYLGFFEFSNRDDVFRHFILNFTNNLRECSREILELLVQNARKKIDPKRVCYLNEKKAIE